MTVHITVDNTDPRGFQNALSKFKTQMKKSGILNDLKKHEHHVAPSKKRRVKRANAAKQRRRDAQLEAKRAKRHDH